MNEIKIDLEGMKGNKELVKAWLDGAKIQIKFKDLTGNSTWYDCDEPEWHPEYEYRIKLTEKYIPFDSSDLLVGRIIKNKLSGSRYMILVQDLDDIFFATDGWNSYKALLEGYSFIDGSPCGKLVEE